MSNEALTEAIAKTIFDYGAKNDYMEPDEFGIVHASTRSIAAAIMLCPELIAALAPPAPHIVDTVEGLQGLPIGAAVLASGDSCWQRWVDGWRFGNMRLSSAHLHADFAPFTVLHVGGAV